MAAQVLELLAWPFLAVYERFWAALYDVVRTLYLHSPNLKYVGGWEGKPLADICAEKSGGASAHWAKNIDECGRIIDAAVYGVSILAQYALLMLAFYYLVRWTFTPRAVPAVVLHMGNSPAAAPPAPSPALPLPAPATRVPNPARVAAGQQAAVTRLTNAKKIALYESWINTCATWAMTSPDKTLGEFFKLNPVPLLLADSSASQVSAGALTDQAEALVESAAKDAGDS